MSTYAERRRVKAALITQKNTGKRGPLPTVRVRKPAEWEQGRPASWKPAPPPAQAKVQPIADPMVRRAVEMAADMATLPHNRRFLRAAAGLPPEGMSYEVRG